MNPDDALAERFEEQRAHLRSVAYRMLGSLSEAEDAVQETWFRLGRTDVSDVANLSGWLTTVTGRVCLDMLRARRARREELGDERLPDPIVAHDPEREVLVADQVGIALMVVMETLAPVERLAFVLHDMFAVPFDEIAAVIDRTPAATRQIASRARRRVKESAPAADPDLDRQRRAVEAFLAAAREGDLEGLVAILDPDVVLRVDTGAGGALRVVRGARNIAGQALMFRRIAGDIQTIVVNGGIGALNVTGGSAQSLMAVTVVNGRITTLDIIADPERLKDLGV
ncbi:sigma-70 family RNA polymerase sigma factor [Actinomadura logoneensis]|uniref:Sigma-70 family RNA polymerase sigma factor n=1 Tax=Actinomadura logoneensis TaxID=2293572 RepID=A0A372JA05_9ACTN|nr:sigma-70 family RNA polymerase sigma factor [Actinomadura logoneensis]RFU36855.1 sigma-70 family RNA polymerase sigma factor [Actinomadura logoneensis]